MLPLPRPPAPSRPLPARLPATVRRPPQPRHVRAASATRPSRSGLRRARRRGRGPLYVFGVFLKRVPSEVMIWRPRYTRAQYVSHWPGYFLLVARLKSGRAGRHQPRGMACPAVFSSESRHCVDPWGAPGPLHARKSGGRGIAVVGWWLVAGALWLWLCKAGRRSSWQRAESREPAGRLHRHRHGANRAQAGVVFALTGR